MFLQCSPSHRFHAFLAGLISTVFLGSVLSTEARAQTADDSISGRIVTVAPNGEMYAVAGAEADLYRVEDDTRMAGDIEVDSEGMLHLPRPADGCYIVRAHAEGLVGQSEPFCLPLATPIATVLVLMVPERLVENVEVAATPTEIDTTQTTSAGAVDAQTLQDAPKVNERFEDVMPLIPGVIRGPDGLINMKGARTSQGGSLVNSANVSDPVTGGSAINLPLDVVSSVEVLSNPFDAQYGKFAGAVSKVRTRTSNFDDFRFSLQNFLPRVRRRGGSFVGLESATPRLTVTGPLVRKKVAITQSFEYRFVRTQIERAGLPPLERDAGVESLDSFTQLDLHLTERHTTNVSLAFYPQKLKNVGLNTFNPQASTPDIHQRGYMLSLQDNLSFNSGALLTTQLSFKDLDVDVRPHGHDPFLVGLELTSGSFFNEQNRRTFRIEAAQTYNFAPLQAAGSHFLKVGVNFARSTYDGKQGFDSATFLGIGGRPSLRTDFTDPAFVSAEQNEYTLFVQDKWNPFRRLTVDLGFRVDRDSVSDTYNLSPRVGMAYMLTGDGRTVLRGGAGFYYDRVNLNVPTFADIPSRTETRFSPSGEVLLVSEYRHRVQGGFENPRSIAWSVQLDREVLRNFFVRTGYQQRTTTRNFLVQPETTADGSYLTLDNGGRDRYREFEVSTRYRINDRSQLSASYVRSQAIGDLNDIGSIFGGLPAALVRPNERSRLAFDAPNRFLFWADIEAPGDITISPVFDLHTGFPFSVVDEQRDFVGGRNEGGRFPRFASTDLQVVKGFKLPFAGKEYKVRAGVRIFNLFNNFNPIDLQNNIASSFFGRFTNFKDRAYRGKFVVEF